ncbi:MAG TPA: glutamate--tRNA ligase family protein, partial [Bacteroidia bacterium]|nr:glutamate--tRNA ligase family protein [Bacteroidia bacterium]
LYRYLGWENVMPQFAHLPLLLRPDGNGKLSKRDGDRLGFPVFPLDWKDPATGEQSSGYRERGYFPDAVVNLLALLGWHPGNNQELFTKEELIEAFSLEKVNKSGAKFDPDKAKWFNQQYLRKTSNADLANMFEKEIINHIEKEVLSPLGERTEWGKYVEGVCHLIKEKAHFVSEFWEIGGFFFIAPDKYDEGVVQKRWNPTTKAFFGLLKDALQNLTDFTHLNIEALFKKTAEENGVAPGSVMQLFRVLVTGMAAGPALFETVELLGGDEVVKRISTALEKLK